MKREITYYVICPSKASYDHMVAQIAGWVSVGAMAVQSYRFEHNRGLCIVRAHTLVDNDALLITIIGDMLKGLGLDDNLWLINTPIEERKEIFAKILSGHDWTYYMSDDRRVIRKGDAYAELIERYLKNNPESEFQRMYDEANPFNNNKTII